MKNIRLLSKRLPITVFLRLVFVKAAKKLFNISTSSYAQTGEDFIISELLKKDKGFYIDVGCNHPIDLSNTFKLYLNGWNGISIDANEDLIKLHKKIRLFDTSIVGAVSDDIQNVTFFKSKSSAVSTINIETHSAWKNKWEFDPKEEITVTTTTLNSILEKNLLLGQEIDLLTIDVEGHELQVLKGIDLAKYHPLLIVVEIHDLDINNIMENNVCKYLCEHGYKLKNYATMNAYFLYIL